MMISGDPPEDASDYFKRYYPGEQSLPLTNEGKQAFREAARDGDVKDRVVGELILLTGIKSSTLAHATSGWLEKDGDRLFIRIPGGKFECTLSTGQEGPTQAGRGQPCRECKNYRDGYWSLNGELNPRRVPIPESDFAEFIDSYFTAHDRLCTPSTFDHRLSKIGERAGFDRRISGSNLRITFGKTLAEKGFSGEMIRQIMGFPDSHSGNGYTQRYFALSDRHDNPPYHCNEKIGSKKTCSNQVFFPHQHCRHHN